MQLIALIPLGAICYILFSLLLNRKDIKTLMELNPLKRKGM